jgi:thiol:disulfide interchange protein
MTHQFLRRLLLLFVLAAAFAGAAENLLAADDPLGGFSLAGAGDSDGALTVHATYTLATKDHPAQLSITAEIPEGWHIFSITQKPGGPNPTRIKLAPSERFKVMGKFVADPAPHIENDPAIFDVPMEEHFGKVTWTAPIEISSGVNPDKLQIRGAVNAQRCSKECLAPEDFKFTAELAKPASGGAGKEKSPGANESSGSPAPTVTEPVAKNSADDGPAQIGEYKSSAHAVIRGWLEPAVVAPGGKAKFVVAAEPAPGWHLYALAPRDTDSVGKPTLIAFNRGAFSAAAQPVPDRAPLEDTSAAEAAGVLSIYDAPVRWTLTIDVPANTAAGDYPLAGLVGFQTCSHSSCDTPQATRFKGKLVVGATTVAGESPLLFRPAKYVDAAALANATAPPGAMAEVPVASHAKSGGPNTLLSLPMAILLGLLGGLILNLMPCVLPVIGLKVMSFVEQSGQSRGRALALNVWYSAGVILVFMVLASLSVTLGLAWGQQFQWPAFSIVLSAVVFAMALSFLGVWEIPIPGFVGSGKAADAAAQEGAFGALAKGVVTTVLATPCSGPLLGAVFFYSSFKQSPAVTYLIFGSIGLGMASPYLLIGMFPRLVRFLPKPGIWMDTFKQLMGFLLLGTVVYLFTLLKTEFVIPTFGLLIGIWFGCWCIGRTPLTADLGRKVRAWGVGGAVAAVIGGCAFWILLPGPMVLDWQPYSETQLEKLTHEGKTVMLDFTARWCPNCKLNSRFAIDTPAVREAVKSNGVVPMVADFSDYAPEIKAKFNSLGSNSIPVLAIYPADRPNDPIVLPDIVSQSQVLDALKRAGPSHKPVAAEKPFSYFVSGAR